MMKLSGILVDATAIENGDWVRGIQGYPGVELKVRGFDNEQATVLRAKIVADLAVEDRTKPDVQRKINAEVLSQTVLLDWKFTDDDGTPLPYSPEAAFEVLNDPKGKDLVQAINIASEMVRRQRSAIEKADAGN